MTMRMIMTMIVMILLMTTTMMIVQMCRFGMAVPFQGDAERAEMFQKMDENGDGSISFDEWLSFSLAEIIAKV
jgi:hypothetical protein